MRRLLSPKWWLVHVVVWAAVLVMLRLGLWQWHRANAGNGGIQNYAYAFQWPVFAVFAVVLWVKTMIEEVRRPAAGDGDPAGAGRPAITPQAEIVQQPGWRIGLTTEAVLVDAAEDPDVAAWNARLAALNAADAAVHSGQGRRR